MKTNRIVALLAVLCLITTCFVGTTLAKYVTTSEASDNARVAKWGVTIEADGTMFNNAYKNTAVDFSAGETVDTITVQTLADVNVVAPGTEGTLAEYDVKGTPETDVEVTYTAELTLTGWEAKADADAAVAFYCPIVIKVGDDTFSGLDYTSAEDFADDVEAAIVDKGTIYHTNTDLSAVNDDVQVSWSWAYAGNDYADTYLGDQAAADNAAEIELATTIAITQVD